MKSELDVWKKKLPLILKLKADDRIKKSFFNLDGISYPKIIAMFDCSAVKNNRITRSFAEQ
jgi:hypothetical protein